MRTPTEIPSADAISRPANTRPAVAPIVIIRASIGVGPDAGLTPIDQRVAVLKNFTWSAKFPTNMCGGGNSFGSEMPNNHRVSQIPENMPMETRVQPTRDSHAGKRSLGGI